MGAMHEVFTPMTAKDIAKKEQKDIATIRLRWNAVFAKGTFDSNRELTQDEINAISRNSKQKSMKSQRKASAKYVHNEVRETENKIVVLQPPAHPVFAKHNFDEIAPEKQPAPATAPAVELLQKKQHLRLPVFGLTELLSVVIYAHTALVWYEVALIFGMPGIFAGVILAALKHSAVVASKNPDYDRFTADTLGVAFVLDALAVYAHYTAFRDALPGNFAQQMGDDGSFWAACVLAVVVASGAFMSLYFINEIRKTK